MIPMSIYASALSLFLVYNVLGNIPFYIAILSRFSARRQKIILVREMCIALFILLLFGYFGEQVLMILGISESIIGISGGILLLIISLTMIFPKDSSNSVPDHEPMIVPIAMPGMAGPGSISAVILFSNTLDASWKVGLVILLAWIPSLLILLAASNIKHLVGDKGLVAFERLGGLLISLIAIQMITSGVIKVVKENFPNTVQHTNHNSS